MKTIKLEIPNERTPSMINHQGLADQNTSRSGQEPTNIQRRTVIGGALAALLSFPGRIMAQGNAVPNDSFVVLLKGLYERPVVKGPNLGLSMVDLDDGSYSTTKIYPVSGTPGNTDPNKAIGDFYGQATGDLCAYHIPGGSFAMRFTGGGEGDPVDDGQGGSILETTWHLDFIEGTGLYRSFVGGHNLMIDRLHFLENGDVDEYCFCHVSGP